MKKEASYLHVLRNPGALIQKFRDIATLDFRTLYDQVRISYREKRLVKTVLGSKSIHPAPWLESNIQRTSLLLGKQAQSGSTIRWYPEYTNHTFAECMKLLLALLDGTPPHTVVLTSGTNGITTAQLSASFGNCPKPLLLVSHYRRGVLFQLHSSSEKPAETQTVSFSGRLVPIERARLAYIIAIARQTELVILGSDKASTSEVKFRLDLLHDKGKKVIFLDARRTPEVLF